MYTVYCMASCCCIPPKLSLQTPTSIASYFYSLLLLFPPKALSLQHSLLQTPTSIGFYFYSLLLLYPPKALSPAQPSPDPYFYSLLLL